MINNIVLTGHYKGFDNDYLLLENDWIEKQQIFKVIIDNRLKDTISNNVQNTLGTTMKTTINPKPLKFLRTLNQKTHYRDEIMFIATSITSLSLNFPDSYQIGLKTLFNK